MVVSVVYTQTECAHFSFSVVFYTCYLYYCFCYYDYLVVLEIKPRALCILDNWSTTESHPRPLLGLLQQSLRIVLKGLASLCR